MALTEDNRESFAKALRDILGKRATLDLCERVVYESDAQTNIESLPDAIVYPETTAEVQAVVRVCNAHDVRFIARGAGTGLSGGAVAIKGGVIIELSRMNRILEVDIPNRLAVVQAAAVNIHLTNLVTPKGFHFAPDPSSQRACTIGGNVAENAGGPHTLKHGVTVNHVLGLEVVLPDGEVIRTGTSNGAPAPGWDLTGLFCGSEGTLGIVTEVTVKLTPNPQGVRTMLAIFNTLDEASETVSGIIREGIIPAALELIDNLAIQSVEAHVKPGFPLDAEAVLLVEVDGAESELDAMAQGVVAVCRKNNCREVRLAADDEERMKLWKGRKQVLGALGKIAPAYYIHDGVVPRSKVPEIFREIRKISEKYKVRIANIAHAGDGSLHPLILFDPKDEDEADRGHHAGGDILKRCVEMGGTLSGEHGIGLEKAGCIYWVFSEDDLDTFQRMHDVFNPHGRCNPGKIFPTVAKRGEVTRIRRKNRGGEI
jgi:glycolate oxidase